MTKTKTPESKAQMEARHCGMIAMAFNVPPGQWAKTRYAQIRSAVYAVVPGRQKHKNIAELMDKATKAVCATVRRQMAK